MSRSPRRPEVEDNILGDLLPGFVSRAYESHVGCAVPSNFRGNLQLRKGGNKFPLIAYKLQNLELFEMGHRSSGSL